MHNVLCFEQMQINSKLDVHLKIQTKYFVNITDLIMLHLHPLRLIFFQYTEYELHKIISAH